MGEPTPHQIEVATRAAFAQIRRQYAGAIDCSEQGDFSRVYAFSDIDLKEVVVAALTATAVE